MSENRTSSDNGFERDLSLNSSSSLRLSIRIPRGFSNNTNSNKNNNINNTISFHEGELMSPRTTTASHPSSSTVNSKEVPRAALFFNKEPPSSSDFIGISDFIEVSSRDSIKEERTLVEDSIQGLKALAASALASLPNEQKNSARLRNMNSQDFINPVGITEDEVLGELFTTKMIDDTSLDTIYSNYCNTESKDQAMDLLNEIIRKADTLIQSKGVSMSLSNIFPVYIQRLLEQEGSRTKQTNFTGLLMDSSFLSASATIILMLPKLVSVLVQIEEVTVALGSNLFDVILTIESVLRAFPEFLSLPDTQRRLKQLQQVLLEDLVWKSEFRDGRNMNTLYKLIISEFKIIDSSSSNPQITATLSGIRSCQKALETLSGFPLTGCKVSRLELFYRKYLRLAFQRLESACQKLGLSQSVIQFSWELFVEMVQSEGCPIIGDGVDVDDGVDSSSKSSEKVQIFLRNRHLNQIILSVIYCTARLLDQERTFQQICQVLPSVKINNVTCVFKNSIDCDFYAFYNEIFIPPLKKKIEKLLNLHKNAQNGSDQWLLSELFTRAPLPINPLYRITGPNTNANVTLNRMNNKHCKRNNNNNNNDNNNDNFPVSMSRYEWISPYVNNINSNNTNYNQTTDTNEQINFNPPPQYKSTF